MKKRFEQRRLARALRRANVLIKRQRGRHELCSALGAFAVARGRHWGSSPWDEGAFPGTGGDLVAGVVTAARRILAKVAERPHQRALGGP
jgi:hypothetical protein